MQDNIEFVKDSTSNNNLFKILSLITLNNNLTAKIDVFASLPYLSYGEDNQEEVSIEHTAHFGIKYFVTKENNIHCFYFTDEKIYYAKHEINEFINCEDIVNENIIYKSIPLNYEELNNGILRCLC